MRAAKYNRRRKSRALRDSRRQAARDRDRGGRLTRLEDHLSMVEGHVHHQFHYLSHLERVSAQQASELEAIHKSRMWKLWMAYCAVMRIVSWLWRGPMWVIRKIVGAIRGAIVGIGQFARGTVTAVFLRSSTWRTQRRAKRRRKRGVGELTVASVDELPEVKTKPRLLILCPYPIYPITHGGAVRLFNLVRRLSERCELHLMIFIRGDDDPVQSAALEPYCAGVHFHHWRPKFDRPAWSPVPPSAWLFGDERASLQLRDIVETHDIDVVQIEYTELSHYRHAVPEGVKVILVEHDLAFRSLDRRRSLKFFERFPESRFFGATTGDWRRLLRFEITACREVDQIHVMSEHDGQDLAAYLDDGVERIRVVPNAVDVEHYQPPDDDRPTDRAGVLMVGNYQNLPNVDAFEFLIEEIWPRVRELMPEATLSVVGAEMPDWFDEHDGRDGIEIVGKVPEMRDWYHSHRVLVVPLRAGSGTRLKLFEAFASGIAAVSTTVGAEGIAYRDGEHLLIGDDAEHFAAGIVQLLENDSLYTVLTAAARRLALERYDWSRSAAANVMGVYELLGLNTGEATSVATAAPEPETIATQDDVAAEDVDIEDRVVAADGDRVTSEDTREADSEPPADALDHAQGNGHRRLPKKRDVDVSVIMPTLNGGWLLDRSLEAIHGQDTKLNFEVVIVDSGSREEDVAMMRRHGVRLHGINKRNFNHGLTRDLGASLARGQVLIFLNQDAVPVDEHWLEGIVAPFDQDDPPAAVQGGILEFPHGTDGVSRFFWDSCGQRFYFTSESEGWIERFEGVGFSTVNAAIRRSV
ncbi:MAG: glycosyltransferase, partial [Acidobacteriota bacterium]